MGTDDWFRSIEWTEEAQGRFEAKLARANRATRPQYVRIQGLTLLDLNSSNHRQAGVALLQRVLVDYPDDKVEAAGAHAALARYYEETGEPQQAAAHYRETLRLQAGTNVSFGAELLLAELIVRNEFADCFAEANDLLDIVLAAGPIIRVEQFRYAVARMRLARHRGQADEAAAFAHGALHLFADNHPISSYHPNVGLIRADEATLAELEDTAQTGNPEKASERVERYRRPDGTVRWEWALTSRLRGVPAGSRLAAQDAFDAEAEPLIHELRGAGFEVYDLLDWATQRLPTAAAVKAAAPILVRWLERTDSPLLKSVIARALTDRRFRSSATAPLLKEFRQMRSPTLNGSDRPDERVALQRRLKDSVAGAVAKLARDEHFEEVVALIRDPAHGPYRTYLFWTLPYMKSDTAVDVALEMLDDDEMHLPALRALANLRSERAQPVLEAIAERPRPRGRNDADERERTRIDIAQAGLQKLQKAQADRENRP